MTGMTKDYAIAILRRMQEPDPYEPQINESAFDALEMAIQALSAQDEDTISRQAALDAIHRYFGSRIENDCPTQLVDGEEIYISTSALNALLAINKALSQAIKELPSCSKMEQVGDCISRQAAIDVIDAILPVDPMKNEYAQGITCGAALAIEYVKQLPSAQPEQQWIPCSEPPKESGTYIVTAYDGMNKRVSFVKYQKTLKRWDLTGARAYWRILAYKPLPEPWEGEDNGTVD